ncbi:proteasome inhibitor PI31 subunit-like [Watersipora subatra]|uniref:proteasome inhibitor PI31 subunit-like n=1 Tax=Watersipora subatra TaxID=2589382 RepID=UPI00355C438D
MEIPGLELLLSSISSTLRDKLDALVAVVHWLIIKEELRCVQNTDEPAKSTELLPPGWNSSSDEYTLTYVHGDKRYSLQVLRMDQAALLHFMEEGSDRLAVLNVNIDDVISSHFRDFSRMFENLDEFYAQFKSEVCPILQPPKQESTCLRQTDDHARRPPLNDPLRSDPLRVGPTRSPYNPHRSGGPSYDPFNIGVGDLDPLRAGQPGMGGMVFDPFRGGSQGGFPRNPRGPGGFLPPGSVPPGARFDPFGPDLDGRGSFRGEPNPDHFRPPDFNDQFM